MMTTAIRRGLLVLAAAAALTSSGAATAAAAVPADDYAVKTVASVHVQPGVEASNFVSTTVTRGNPQAIHLNSTGDDAGGPYLYFDNVSISSGQTTRYVIVVPSETAPGSYLVSIHGTAGSLDHWAQLYIIVGPRSSCAVTNGTDTQIPDLGRVDDAVTLADCGGNALAATHVGVHIVHTWRGDLSVSLIAPDGSSYLLTGPSGGSADNLDQTFTVDLSSEARNGIWKLEVSDVGFGDTGYINSWTLDTNSGAPNCTGFNGADVNIPRGPGQGHVYVQSPITPTGCSGYASATSTFKAHMIHRLPEYLNAFLVSPNGNTYQVIVGGAAPGTPHAATDVDVSFTIDLSHDLRQGTWRLYVEDYGNVASGYLESWGLHM